MVDLEEVDLHASSNYSAIKHIMWPEEYDVGLSLLFEPGLVQDSLATEWVI